MLASLLYPYDVDAGDLIDSWLDELELQACVQRYRIGDDEYLAITEWKKHQRIDKPSESKIPPPPPKTGNGSGGLLEHSTTPREDSANVPRTILVGLDRKGREGNRKGKEKPLVQKSPPRRQPTGAPEGFEQFWSSYPKGNRRVARLVCLGLWEKGGLEIEAPDIVAHVQAMAASEEWRKDGGQFVPLATTYLRGRRWEGFEARTADDDKPDWRESRAGLDLRGEALGIGTYGDFSQEFMRRGQQPPSLQAYQRRVIEADADATAGAH